MRLSATRNVVRSMGVVVLGGMLLAPSAATAAWAPDFEAPFLCGQDWRAETRSDHSPSQYAVDFNKDDDYRAPVRAAAPGRVTSVVDLGGSSYGKYIVIEHPSGWESLYAHLDAQLVVKGQRVDQGALIGLLGTTGGSSGPHLHFEQKLHRTVKHAVFHGIRLVYNTRINSYNCADVPVAGDWNGDGRTEVGVFRPKPGANVFRLRARSGDVTKVRLGRPGDIPITGDWNGNGRTDVGIWRRMSQTFLLRLDSGKERVFAFGKLREIPIAGDWNGDGTFEVGMFSPADHEFRLRAANGTVRKFSFGGVGSVPLTGDWDGDDRTEVGAYASGSRTWTLREAKGKVRKETFGGVGGIPVTGAWGKNGVSRPATWGPKKGVFKLQSKSGSDTIAFGRPRR